MSKKYLFAITGFILLFVPVVLFAEEYKKEIPEATFEKMIQVSPVSANTPVIIEIPLLESISSNERFLVRENETGRYLGSYFKRETVSRIRTQSTASQPVDTRNIHDGRLDTHTNFPVPDEGVGRVTFTIQTSQPITTSQILLNLDKNVALPLTAEISFWNQSTEGFERILAKREVNGRSISFPEITADQFVVTFTYMQPLRIAELTFSETRPITERSQSLRFLALPQYSYTVYYGADRYVSYVEAETGNLLSDDGAIVTVQNPIVTRNPAYQPADSDGDGIIDLFDNCVHIYNPDQEDIDGNGRGDACDDWDRDGIINSLDNCVNIPNRNQQDTDRDGIGDACDEEESRFTERNPWIPWVGMGTAATVLLVLFAMVARRPKVEGVEESKEVE